MNEPLIRIIEASYRYQQEHAGTGYTGQQTQAKEQTEADVYALDKVNLDIYQGEYLAILGPNGSGKSTLARHLNGLLVPSQGQVLVSGLDTRDVSSIWEIRSKVSMVFQNPDDQIVGVTVEEDVAFGPENLGLAPDEIRRRVDQALGAVEMLDYKQERPDRLSGGQKQKVALAGALAMQPSCLVLDEVTGWLDPRGRKLVLDKLKQLNGERKISIVHITHSMSEALLADRIVVLAEGQIVLVGTPEEVFGQADLLLSLGLDVPLRMKYDQEIEACQGTGASRVIKEAAKPLLQFQEVKYTYSAGMPWAKTALSEINLQVAAGEFLGIAGHTGSGKSTLMRMFNGLLKPSGGKVLLEGRDIHQGRTDWSTLCSRVGLVMQFPEHQLFEATVFEDVAFGPRNLQWPVERVELAVQKALGLVGLDYAAYAQVSPFALSEGQKRRVAMAGILSMEPSVLVLDEPVVGLDPQGRRELLDLLGQINWENNLTIIMTSHNMDELARYARRIVVLNEGKLVMDDSPQAVFSRKCELEQMGLDIPEVAKLRQVRR